MRHATRLTVSTFGTLMALAGLEHGIGALVQGNTAPGGLVFKSWPDSAFFAILDGEPAMTIVPNLLVSGILTVLVSLIALAWSTRFIGRRHGSLVMLGISLVMLLVGGGFGPPILGLIVAGAASGLNAPLAWWRARRSARFLRFLGTSWRWSYSACLIAWLYLFPGSTILAYFFGLYSSDLVLLAILCAFGGLLLTIFSGYARDAQVTAG